MFVLSGFLMTTMTNSVLGQNKTKNLVKVYYFHSDFRCATCLKIESLISDAMKEKFKSQIEQGKVIFQVVNFSEKKNQHFEKDYDLYNQTLVISQVKDGKETKWKAAEKIWELHDNKTKFKSYVDKEVKDYLKGL
jgi:hypothetical protein